MVVRKILSNAQTLKTEFKKQTATAIMAAFGLVIALAWKDVITNVVSTISWINSYGPLVSAVILTVISVLGILLVSRWANAGDKK